MRVAVGRWIGRSAGEFKVRHKVPRRKLLPNRQKFSLIVQFPMRTPKPDRYPPPRQFCRRLLPAIAALVLLRFPLTAFADTLTTLHDFTDSYPSGPVIQASDGNFYGTAFSGVFKITPSGVLTTVQNFSGSDGSTPFGGVIQARDGNFYGTTFFGTDTPAGIVFRLTPDGVLTTVHKFSDAEGNYLVSSVIQGYDGNFYGTANSGGNNGFGTVFRLTAAGVFTTLHSFSGSDGTYPDAGLIQAFDGNLYGTASGGGNGIGYGTCL